MTHSLAPVAEIVTHLIDATEPSAGQSQPRVGDPVELRPDNRGRDVVAWSASGRRLGRVPPPDRDTIAELLVHQPLQGRITALVPRPPQAGAGRIHIRVSATD